MEPDAICDGAGVERRVNFQGLRQRITTKPATHRCGALSRYRWIYCGQAAPFFTHSRIAAAKSGRLSGGGARPSPGFQPHPTRSSSET